MRITANQECSWYLTKRHHIFFRIFKNIQEHSLSAPFICKHVVYNIEDSNYENKVLSKKKKKCWVGDCQDQPT
jgi:hypothetical protein